MDADADDVSDVAPMGASVKDSGAMEEEGVKEIAKFTQVRPSKSPNEKSHQATKLKQTQVCVFVCWGRLICVCVCGTSKLVCVSEKDECQTSLLQTASFALLA